MSATGDGPTHSLVAQRNRKGFTLVELLVATVVLALLLTLLLKISGNTLEVTRVSRQNLDAMQRTRVALDALGADLQNLVTQFGGTVFLRQDSSKNVDIVFLTRNRGPATATNCRFMAVAYQLTSGGKLIRRTSPVSWSSKDIWTDLASAVTSTTSSTLADSVIREDAVLTLDNGSIVPLTQTGTWLTDKINDQSLPAGLNGFSALVLSHPPVTAAKPRVQSITVGLAAVESKTYRLPNVPALGTLLVSPTAGETPFDLWSKAIMDGSLASSSSAPKSAVAALQISQKTFPLR